MKIITIWGQQRCDYPDEYAPDLLAAIDELGDDDNPDYMLDEMIKANKLVANREYDFVKRMEFEIDDDEFDEVFFGKTIKMNIAKEK